MIPGMLANGNITFFIYLFIGLVWIVGKFMQQKEAQRKVEELKRRREERERQQGGRSQAEMRPETQPAMRYDAKSETRPEMRYDAQSESQPEMRYAAQPRPQAEHQAENQSEPKTQKKTIEDQLEEFLGRMAGFSPEPEPAPPPPPPPPKPKKVIQFDGPKPKPPAPIPQKVPAPTPAVPAGTYAMREGFQEIQDIEDIKEMANALEEGAPMDDSALASVRTMMVDMSRSNMRMQRIKIKTIRPVITRTSKPNLKSNTAIKQAIVSGILLSKPKALQEDPFRSEPGAL